MAFGPAEKSDSAPPPRSFDADQRGRPSSVPARLAMAPTATPAVHLVRLAHEQARQEASAVLQAGRGEPLPIASRPEWRAGLPPPSATPASDSEVETIRREPRRSPGRAR